MARAEVSDPAPGDDAESCVDMVAGLYMGFRFPPNKQQWHAVAELGA